MSIYLGQEAAAFREKRLELLRRQDYARIFSQVDSYVLSNYLSGFSGKSLSVRSWDELMALLESFENDIRLHTAPSVITDIQTIQEYIQQNYAHDVSIASVSEHFNLSPTYLSRLFHEKTGQKYIDFVTEIRMEAAKKILTATPDISVKQVAAYVGYSSVRHFSKNFQKYTGILPSNFQ